MSFMGQRILMLSHEYFAYTMLLHCERKPVREFTGIVIYEKNALN